MARLSLEHVGARFGATEVLRDISMEVADGEFLVLVGPSGCGKSTLLRVVAGLVAPSAGEIRIDGRRVNELEPRERKVAMVFQNYALYPHRTVAKNLAFPLEIARVDREEIRARVRETAEVLGLTALLERKPGRLSGGQMQRVALGRAIIRRPSLFLFDEPLSNLDAKLRAEMRAEIGRLHQRLATTSLYVTHDQAEAMTMGSRIAVLDGGRIEQIGPPLEVYARPATRFVAGFIGTPAMNLVEGTLGGGRFRRGALEIAAPGRDGDALVLGLRPHALALRAPRAGELGLRLPATLVESLGSQTVVHLALGDAALVAAAEGTLAVRAGETIEASFSPADVHWFDAHTGRRRTDP